MIRENRDLKILITGAAGFIGSCLVTELNNQGFNQLILTDNFDKSDKDRYLNGKKFVRKTLVSDLLTTLEKGEISPNFIFHLGGKTSGKPEQFEQNLLFPQRLFNWCKDRNIPFLYASSAYTYGAGEYGYNDAPEILPHLKPQNDYGRAKHQFDLWMTENGKSHPWAGLKFFNVYGPNEYHKGRSSSVAFKSYFEIERTGKLVLFGSSSPEYSAGEQQRDFIYVKDMTRICYWFLERWITQPDNFPSGIYNAGTGVARSFNDVARSVFNVMELPEKIEYKPIPADVLPHYPGCVKAEMNKLRRVGYNLPMLKLEEGIEDMVREYLSEKKTL